PLIREKCDTVIGFKAESGLTKKALAARARERLEAYDLTAVVANDIDSAGKTSASVILVSAKGEKDITGTKESIANSILDICS
ncbi:MAG: phosphopantothenoylcysteine decarboxylase, partial [Candidatus Methanomethylophilaceae archaeon]|nr:phosphopantothenoylcysteine decarboxylase [Candidatus Methanomethylophilaceae archaeon]